MVLTYCFVPFAVLAAVCAQTLEERVAALEQAGYATKADIASSMAGLKIRLDSLEERVAFTVEPKTYEWTTDTHTTVSCVENTPLLFNHPLTNLGGYYNTITGVFTAPYEGVYWLSLTLYAKRGHSPAAMMMKNGNIPLLGVSVALKNRDFSKGSSNSIITLLKAQDTVSLLGVANGELQHDYGQNNVSPYLKQNTFSGYMLHKCEFEHPCPDYPN